MALTQNGLMAGVRTWLDGFANERLARYANARFVRFMGVSAVALTTSLVTVAVCDGVFHMTSVPTALISQVTGALVSYVLSRRAWGRRGKPDVLRETIPFWIVFVIATVISWAFTKLGYRTAAWMHLHGIKNVLVVEVIYFIGNVVTFLMRFVIFHYVLFADRHKTATDAVAGAAATAATANAASADLSRPGAHRRPLRDAQDRGGGRLGE
ncbi:MAG: GtrA family protein [Trebonia sp.]